MIGCVNRRSEAYRDSSSSYEEEGKKGFHPVMLQ